MPAKSLVFNCGGTELGGWIRSNLDTYDPKNRNAYLTEYEQEIIKAKKANKIVIATVLKEQKQIRALLKKHNFKKGVEIKSKYKESNTQCVYYWGDFVEPKARKAKAKETDSTINTFEKARNDILALAEPQTNLIVDF